LFLVLQEYLEVLVIKMFLKLKLQVVEELEQPQQQQLIQHLIKYQQVVLHIPLEL
jgi:hypothetical protein